METKTNEETLLSIRDARNAVCKCSIDNVDQVRNSIDFELIEWTVLWTNLGSSPKALSFSSMNWHWICLCDVPLIQFVHSTLVISRALQSICTRARQLEFQLVQQIPNGPWSIIEWKSMIFLLLLHFANCPWISNLCTGLGAKIFDDYPKFVVNYVRSIA